MCQQDIYEEVKLDVNQFTDVPFERDTATDGEFYTGIVQRRV